MGLGGTHRKKGGLMARKKLTPQKKKEICTLYEDIGSYNGVAKKAKVVPNTVKKVWLNKDTDPDLRDFVQEYRSIKKQSDQELLDKIRSSQYANITQTAMNLLNEYNLETEIQQRGIRSLITLIGNSADKVIATEELEIKKRQMSVKEKELALRERELEARLEQPDAFKDVQIINDAPEPKEDKNNDQSENGGLNYA